MSDKPYEFIETEEESDKVTAEDVEEIWMSPSSKITDTKVDEEIIDTSELVENFEEQEGDNNDGNNVVHTGKVVGVIDSIVNKVTSIFEGK
jgi:hypothetical protein